MDSPHPYTHDSRIFFVLVAIFITATIVFFLAVVLHTERNITTYAECTQSKTSKILETYPEICMTAGGKRFVNPTADHLVPPTEPSPTPEPLSFSLPTAWQEIQPDPTMVDAEGDIMTHEFMKVGENRGYPVGRITAQMTKRSGTLEVPNSVFTPESETISGIDYTVVTGEENGYRYRVYYGEANGYFLRIFLRFQQEFELTEQRDILATFQFTQ